jgi:hypothetical protein
VRVKTDQLKDPVEFTIDEDEVRSNVAIAKTLPRTGQRVIHMPHGKRLILSQMVDHIGQNIRRELSIWTRL